MRHCPFCDEVIGPNDYVLGIGTYCSRCGKRVEDHTPDEATAPEPSESLSRPDEEEAAATTVAAAPAVSVVPFGQHREEVPLIAPNRPEAEEPDDGESPSHLTGVKALYAAMLRLDGATLGVFVLGSVGLLLASIEPLSFLSKPVSGLGLLLGLAGSVIPAVVKKRALGFPLAMSGLCLVILLLAGDWPREPPTPPPPLVAISLKAAGMVANRPISDDDWVDASADAIQRHNVRVAILSARVGNVELKSEGKASQSRDRFLMIQLFITHHGLKFEPLTYEPWADQPQSPSKNQPLLTDNLNRVYTQKTFDSPLTVAGRSEGNVILPGGDLDELLVYPVPSPKIEYLRISLPGAAFGGAGAFRFQVPRSMIKDL